MIHNLIGLLQNIWVGFADNNFEGLNGGRQVSKKALGNWSFEIY